MTQNISFKQKIMFYVLIGLIILMIIFSLQASQNRGKEGFENCIEKKCTTRTLAFCQKPREISNCCLGAGGQLAQQEGKLTCIFP